MQIFQIVDEVSLIDPVVELYLWERLTFNSYFENQHQIVSSCVEKVLKIKENYLNILMKEKTSQTKE